VKAGQPVKGTTAFVSDTSITVTFEDAPPGIYEAPADEEFREIARARGGILACGPRAGEAGSLTGCTGAGHCSRPTARRHAVFRRSRVRYSASAHENRS